MTYERLSAQDSVFLHIENATQPQHVGSLGILEAAPFRGENGAFRFDDALEVIGSRLHLVPRFRKRIMTVPFEQGRPVWVDDGEFDLSYHVRLTALPSPGSEAQLEAQFARIQEHLLDRSRPLWELWFVEGLDGDRVAIIQKTHHCLIDGVSGVDVATVLLDLEPNPPPTIVPEWVPEPAPNPQQLLVESLVERATHPAEIMRSFRAALRTPMAFAGRAGQFTSALVTSAKAPPTMPWNVPITAHRRWLPARVELADVRSVKDAATKAKLTNEPVSVNDVVLAACTSSLRRFLIERDVPIDDLVLRAMVPVSMRSADEQGALGNRVSMVPADLPVGEDDPLQRLVAVHDNMSTLKSSGIAVAGDDLVQMTNYLPPTLLGVVSRLLVRSGAVNTTITNIPGPQFPLYCMGARLLEAFPYVGIVDNMALTIAVVSYDGRLGFGLTGDRDVLPDLESIARGIEDAVAQLAELLDAPKKGATT